MMGVLSFLWVSLKRICDWVVCGGIMVVFFIILLPMIVVEWIDESLDPPKTNRGYSKENDL